MTTWTKILVALNLLGAVISISLYADQSWVWSILTNRYQGWTYAATLGIVTLYLAIRFLPLLSRPDLREQPAPKNAD